jgi:transposase
MLLQRLRMPHAARQFEDVAAVDMQPYSGCISWVIARRQVNASKRACDIAWKAQLRLCARFGRLSARRLPRNKVIVAIARELAGFVWAIAREVKPL